MTQSLDPDLILHSEIRIQRFLFRNLTS